MVSELAYEEIRQQLLAKNPYFSDDLRQVRRELGLPEDGFKKAVARLEETFPLDELDFRTGDPEIPKLLDLAESLGLPLEDRVKEWRDWYVEQGLVLEQVVEHRGWGVLPIFSPLEWAQWWTERERKNAQVEGLPPQLGKDSTLDEGLPSAKKAKWLVERYRLGADFFPSMHSIILGCGEGGGKADMEIEVREDGGGINITLNRIPYSCTKLEWDLIYSEVVEPCLLDGSGLIRPGLSFSEGLADGRRRAKPGRPPYSQETLDDHLLMWNFCHQKGYLSSGLGEDVFGAFLESLPDDDQRSRLEALDLETFRRDVKRFDQHLRPIGNVTTGSEPHFRS